MQQRRNPILRGLGLLRRDPRRLAIGAYRRTFRILSDLPDDIRLNISTGFLKRRYAVEGTQVYGYEPVPYVTLRDVRRHMRARDVSARTFIDVGCGLGRPLYFFAADFDHLVGYEIVPQIFEDAVTQWRSVCKANERYRNLRFVQADATSSLPLDQKMVVFLYNPFGPDLMRNLADRLKQSVCGFDIYYVNPLFFDVLEERLGVVSEKFSSFLEVRHFCVGSRSGRD